MFKDNHLEIFDIDIILVFEKYVLDEKVILSTLCVLTKVRLSGTSMNHACVAFQRSPD